VEYPEQTVAVVTAQRHRHALARGLGIAFNAKPAVQEHANVALSCRTRRVLYFLGISREEIDDE